MTWLIWTPCGQNSLARDWDNARSPNFAEAKEAKFADALTEAVAPVKISVGGYFVVAEAVDNRSGITACEKMKAALLYNEFYLEWGSVHLTFPMALESGDGDIEERTFEVFLISAPKVEYGCHHRDTKFLDFFGSLSFNINCNEMKLSSCCPHRDNPLEVRSTVQVRWFQEIPTSPPSLLIDSEIVSRVPWDRARRTTLYSFANRRERDAPKPGPTPAITASPKYLISAILE